MKVLTATGREKVTPGFPVGSIAMFSGYEIPDGWLLCDGTGGTPDLRDRFLVGASAVGAGTASGTVSPVTGFTHAGAASTAHSDHTVTQPGAHTDHGVTQPGAHSGHAPTEAATHSTHALGGNHAHDPHTTAARTTVGLAAEVTVPTEHSPEGGHAHDAHGAHAGSTIDAHSAHSGATVDAHSAHAFAVDAHSAHSVTQANAHSVWNHCLLVFVMRVA